MKPSPQVIPMADSSEQISPDDLIPTFLPDAFLRSEAAINMQRFKLPRYDDLPEIPLYREQVISYIEGVFEPLSCCVEGPWITPSMVNNYVKAGLVPPPVKKLYGEDQLALLVAICIFKQVLSMSMTVGAFDRMESRSTLFSSNPTFLSRSKSKKDAIRS